MSLQHRTRKEYKAHCIVLRPFRGCSFPVVGLSLTMPFARTGCCLPRGIGLVEISRLTALRFALELLANPAKNLLFFIYFEIAQYHFLLTMSSSYVMTCSYTEILVEKGLSSTRLLEKVLVSSYHVLKQKFNVKALCLSCVHATLMIYCVK
jgi:hypothetical protein